jgi:ligand-binding sensor domain-containing protein
MKRGARRVATIAIGAVVVGVGLLCVYVFHVVPKRVDRAIAEARRSGSAREVAVRAGASRAWGEGRRQGVTPLTSIRDFTDGAQAFGRVFAATPGGVVVLGPDGAWDRTLTWADGLGAAAGTAIVPHGARLAMGGSDGSVTLFDDEKVQVVRFDTGATDAPVTELASDGDLLYVGTFGAGLIVWDGEHAAALDSASGERLGEITALALGRSGLAVGTASGAVLVRRDGRLVPIERQGSPDDGERAQAPRDRVTALAWEGESIWIGTPFGLTRVGPDGRVERTRPDLFVTSLLFDAAAQKLYAGTFDSGVIVIEGSGERSLGGRQRISRIRMIDGRPVAFGPGGAWQLAEGAFVPLPQRVPASLAGSHVTALAVRGGSLWAGTFEDGLDVIDQTGKPVTHLPPAGAAYGLDQINDLDPRDEAGEVVISTVRGVVIVSDGGSRRIGLGDGLIGEQVQAAAWHGGRLALATNRGVTVVGEDGIARSVYALHGLANNHCYAAAWGGDGKLYVGTLGGLSILETDLVVDKNIVAGKTGLRSAWVTALAAAPEGMYVGTYGGGVVRVLPDGTVDDVSVATGAAKLRINPGALVLDGDRLYAGSLDDGLFVYDRRGRAWRAVSVELGSKSVTAIARWGDALWIGTDAGLTRIEMSVIDAALSPRS